MEAICYNTQQLKHPAYLAFKKTWYPSCLIKLFQQIWSLWKNW